MSATATAFLTGSTIRNNSDSRDSSAFREYPCRRRLPAPLPQTKVVCADKVCASEFEVSHLSANEIQTERLNVQQDMLTGSLTIGAPSVMEECTSTLGDQALVVYGNAHIGDKPYCSPHTTLTIDGTLELSSTSHAPAKIVASSECRATPLILDIAYDENGTHCGRVSDFDAAHYASRGPGVTSEIKCVRALVDSCPYNNLLGWLDTKVLPKSDAKQLVLQSMSTTPIDTWSTSGILQRSGYAGHDWGKWQEVSAKVIM